MVPKELDPGIGHPVCGTMAKTGLRLPSTDLHDTVIHKLFTARIITRALIERAGFVVIDDYPNPPATREHEISPSKNDIYPQNLHADGASQYDVITLRYRGESGKRDADTVIAAETVPLFRQFVAFLQTPEFVSATDDLENAGKAQLFIRRVRQKLKDLGIGDIGKGLDCLSRWPVREKMRKVLYSTAEALNGHPALIPFYKRLEEYGLLYRHRWQKDQVMIVQNSKMLHARCPRDTLPEDADAAPLLRRFYRYRGDRIVSC